MNIGGNRDLLMLYKNFTERKLYKRCYLHITRDMPGSLIEDLHYNKNNKRDKFEESIASKLKISSLEIGLHCPSTDMYLKEADVLSMPNSEEVKKLSELKNYDIDNIVYKHRCIWRLYLFIAPHKYTLADKAGELCEKELGLLNELPLERRGQLVLWGKNEI